MTHQKIITVSGLYSGIGKTGLCCHIISLLPGVSAVKVTINDHITEVLDDEESIMVPGKDTWRLKTSGAAQVLWVRAREEDLPEALVRAFRRLTAAAAVLIEGNSAVAHIQPDLAFFVCDRRISFDRPPKPSRTAALAKADVIINNVRSGADAAEESVANAVRRHNPSAPVFSLDIAKAGQAREFLRGLLREQKLIPSF